MIKHNQRGDTIIEVLFAMTIIALVLAAAYSVASKNLQVSQLSKERVQATELAVGQLDQIKALDNKPANGRFCIDIEQNPGIILESDTANYDTYCVDERYTKLIEKTDENKYRVEVSWTPPDGNEDADTKVEFFYDDYNFSIVGSSDVLLALVSSTGTSAQLGVTVLNDDDPAALRGIVYGTNPDPEIGGSGVINSSGTGSPFTVTISSLDPDTTYYVRAYLYISGTPVYSTPVAINGQGLVGIAPTLDPTSYAAATLTEDSVEVTGTVVADGGSSVISQGIAYGTSPNPYISDGFKNGGTPGTPSYSFTATLNGLLSNTTYYARAYAANENGTSYGQQVTFTTDPLSAPGYSPTGTLDGSVYYLFNTRLTWEQANSQAQSLGGHLVSITSQEENDFVSNMAGGERIWIGFNDIANEGNWQWTTGESASYQNWRTTPVAEPNNSGSGEHAAVMNWNGISSGDWNDWGHNSSSDTAWFIVEFDSYYSGAPSPSKNIKGSDNYECITDLGGPCTEVGNSVYACRNYKADFIMEPPTGNDYTELKLIYGDSPLCGGAPTPPEGSYDYDVDIYINNVLNSTHTLANNGTTNNLEAILPLSGLPDVITSVSVEWTNNTLVNVSGVNYKPDLRITNLTLQK